MRLRGGVIRAASINFAAIARNRFQEFTGLKNVDFFGTENNE
jgi:hypothetical protein